MRGIVAIAALGLASCLRAGFDPTSSSGDHDAARTDLRPDARQDRAAAERRILDLADLPRGPDRGPDRDVGAIGRGAFLLFGADGRRLVSFDQGSTWPVDQQDPVSTGTSDRRLTSAAWKEGVAVIVGGPWGASGGFAMRSNDGTSWIESTIAGGQGPIGVAFGAGVFVTLNNVGDLHTSADGITWAFGGSNAAEARSICFGQNRFFAVGDNGRISTSSDGTTWKTTTLGGSSLTAAVCGPDRFLAIGENRRVTTLDGTTLLADQAVPGLCACGELAHGLGFFIDYACNTSSDGLTWSAPTSSCSMYSIAFGDGVFLATSKTENKVMRSSDGKTWQSLRSLPSNPEAFHVRFVRFP